MSLNDIATIVVSSSGAGVTRQGYGIGMITSFTATWAERFRSYGSLSAVGNDFAANTPEYLAASAYFNQNPSPTTLIIGRCALTPTQQWTVAVATGAVALNTNYGVNVSVATGVVRPLQNANYITGGATGWVASGVFSKGYLVAAGVNSLYSNLGVSGPSGLLGNNSATGIAAGTGGGPSGIAATIQDGQVYWQYVGTGSTGAVTNDAIILGLQAQLDALSGPVAVGTGPNQVTTTTPGSLGALQLQINANVGGKFVGVASTNRAALWTSQTHADAGIATDLAAIKNASSAWYGLITTLNSLALVSSAAAWVESNSKLYPAASADTAVPETALAGATDVAATLKSGGYTRSWVMSHPNAVEFADAAEMGRFFPINPGGETWRMKPLSGITTQLYSDNEIANLKAKYAHYYYDFGGGFGVVGGDAKSAFGEYVDSVRFIDWYSSNLQGDLADAAVAANKIPFTNQGIDLVEGIVRKRNAAGIAAGGISTNPAPIVTAPDVNNVSATDKANRELSGVNTQWTLAGAIHHFTVSVTANT